MQTSWSQSGISIAILRFSHFVVPVGQVPSGGKADTGSRSPLFASITAVTFWTKSGASSETMGGRLKVEVTASGTLDLVQMIQGRIDRGEVLLDQHLTLLAVGLLDGFLDLLDGFRLGQDVGQSEEAGLHDGIETTTHARFARHLIAVDDPELQLLLEDGLLDFAGQMLPDLIRAVGGVQQEGRAVIGILQNVEPLQEVELMTGDKGGLLDEIGRVDRLGAKAQVRDRDRAGLLGVVDEVALGVVVGLFADDLDGVLVGTDGAVGTQTPEDGSHSILGLDVEWFDGQGSVGHIIDDADREVIAGSFAAHLVEDGPHMGGSRTPWRTGRSGRPGCVAGVVSRCHCGPRAMR